MDDGAPETEQDTYATAERPALVVRCGPEGILTFANDNYCRLVGRTRAQLQGHSFWSFLPAKERRRGRRHVRSLTPDEPAAAIEYVLDARPGRVRRQRWINHARFDDAGRLIEWLAMGEEECIADAPDWLALTQAAAIGVLAGSIAHELNQPLMSSSTNVQAALKFLSGPSPNLDEARAALTDIGQSVKRLAAMVRSLLDKLKRHATEHVALDINALAADVIRLVGRQRRPCRTIIESQLGADLPRVSGDRIQLQQVVLNLLLNACDAVEAVEPRRRRAIVRTERDGDAVLVSVIDSGIGIPAGDLSRVFDPFYTTKTHGTGLGLAISRTIVTLHGGRLVTTRNAEGGMTFCFKLPAAPSPARQGTAS
jgi:signal transduction histidine kinase